MTTPAISVVLPVFNGDAFLSRSMQSILEQTFSNFELIIINDGSTDNSENIILTFTDSRIVYIKNKHNIGLIASLNRAIKISRGHYIARMDADDIAINTRLEEQMNFLEKNKKIGAVATTITFINEAEENMGAWNLDTKTTSVATIKRTLPFKNCIAHPTMMIRTAILQQNLYATHQKNIEDYDLWLRLLNQRINIAKVDKPLLLYRIHKDSITTLSLRPKNIVWKNFKMKVLFLKNEFLNARINEFTLLVLFASLVDLGTAIFKRTKQLFN